MDCVTVEDVILVTGGDFEDVDGFIEYVVPADVACFLLVKVGM